MAGDDATIPDTPSAAAASQRQVKIPARYRITGVLGEGGMGRVYRAHDTTLGRDVAIKMIEKDLHGRDQTLQAERFVREARAAARLVHPNIVQVHDVDPEAGWLVMALVDGTPLRDLPLPAPIKLTRRIAEQVLSALEAAHAANVIHRDIKPSNIVIGADNHVTLVDFGVARLLDGELTQTGESLGTPAYMAPEQLRGAQVDARADLYSLGATLYELVTGERIAAFESPSQAALAEVRGKCGEQIGLARVIEHCLQGDPRERFESATMALAALVNASDPFLAVKPKPRAKRPRRRGLAIAAILLALAVAGAAAWLLWLREPAADPRLADAFTQAQRGEHERAAQILDDYLGQHPSDPEALTLRVITGWWMGAEIGELMKRAVDAPLTKVQRAMLRGIQLTIDRREAEAAAYLAAAERELPGSPEIVYLLGEAQWHSQQLDTGAATLERAFQLDPRWQVALHHVIEYRLIRGETAKLVPLVAPLRTVDRSSAAALECQIAIGERAYAQAAAVAREALAHKPIPELHICLSHALVLGGDLAASAEAARRAFELWPIDTREWGGFALHAEQLLYRGRLDEYNALVRGKPSRQRSLALALWQPTPELAEPDPSDRKIRTPPPLGAALWILIRQTQGHDEATVYNTYGEPEVRLYGQGLWAETRGDRATAIARYTEALGVPAKGDIHMLLSHHLARVRHAGGDAAGAARACEAVIAPRVYQPYRAVLVPDCVLWSGDRAAYRRLADAWQGSTFAHPAVVEVRKRLEQP